MTPRNSDLTVTDVFCGAGGNTIGAKKAGMRVRVGLNHWERAIETYAANNREVDIVERVDVSLCDPRRYPSTDIGIFSPECTTHSPAGGNRHQDQGDLFAKRLRDPETIRSRVTMFDVVRFTEYHRYHIVIVENVVEATKWELFPDWLRMMGHLGYEHRIVSRNSMVHHPTPQSRDRIYVVFWRKGNRAPDLDHRPAAPCPRCACDVHAVQAWKNGRTIGKYRRQYVYACPRCATTVTPYYYAALNALDLSIPAERIGDRKKALRPRTRDRVQYGLDKHGRRPLIVNVKQGARDGSRAWPADLREMGSVPTWDNYFGVAQPSAVIDPSPFLVTLRTNGKARSVADEFPAMCAGGEHHAIVGAPFLVNQHHSTGGPLARGADAPMGTCVATGRPALVSLTPFLVACANAGGDERRTLGLDEPLRTVHAGGGNHAIVTGAQISMRDADAMRVAGLDAELMTQGCGPQQAVMSPGRFLVSYYASGGESSPLDGPVPTVPTHDRHALVEASGRDRLSVDDCYFRMLEPHEIGRAMAFPDEYRVEGTKRDRVKMYGNAVTPPVMDWIVRRCAATLAPELTEGDADAA